MKIKSLFLILPLLLLSFKTISQVRSNALPNSFKIVGYYFLYTAVRDTIHADSTYQFLNKITHLNIAFINPDSAGNFRNDLAIDTLIKKAHQKNVKVLASLGGGSAHPYFAALLDNKNRKMFIDNLVSMVKRYDLDGVDVDIEGDDIDGNYTKFVVGLAAALKPEKKLITAAIATAYKDQLPDKALKQFDFVNIMSYDNTGPWRPQDPGDPSPYSMAVDDLDYWHDTRGIPEEKLVLGLPFYGYGFGKDNSPVVSMNYNQIVSLYPNSELSDTLNLPRDVVMYFNNIATIKEKTELAMQKGGGVMIWQLLGDAPGSNSLLNAIYQLVHK